MSNTETYTGHDIPAKQKLVEEGWEFRCNTDDNRLLEVIDMYMELGYEVHLEPVDLCKLSELCGGCSGILSNFKAVYTRK
jgi:hypothetical protein